jgi:uncharacterized membrane protein YqgA involved in biofilm formation
VIHVTGTLINAGTVLVGTAAGLLLGRRFPEHIRETIMSALGLMVILIGVDAGLQAFRGPLRDLTRGSVLIVLGSALAGGIVGELLGIERGLNAAGEALKRRFARGRSESTFTEGFVVASLVFCVGPLTILGTLRDGLTGDYQLLAVKAMLDGFAALAFSSALGWGVGFSVLTILIYQGGLSILFGEVGRHIMNPDQSPAVAAVTAAGGVLILAIGLRLLRLREIRVANLLPALLLAPAAVVVFERLR